MLSAERMERIRRELATHGSVLAGEQAVRFGVSEDTVRRDLRELARAGLCRRVYGGAIAAAPETGPLAVRLDQEGEAKTLLAEAAVRLVRPGQTIFIDSSSTNVAIARALPADLELTVATNAPSVAAALEGHVRVRLIVLGGLLDRDKGACVGGSTLRMIDEMRADLLFLGTCGIHATRGATAFDHEEAEVKRAMARNSDVLAAAVTNGKLDTAAPFKIVDRLQHLIVGADAPAPFLAAIANAGTEVHRAGSVAGGAS